MKKVFTKALSLLLVAIMLTSTMLVGVSAEEATPAPVVTVQLTPGKETNKAEKVEVENDGIYTRTVIATTGEVVTTSTQTAGDFKSIQSVPKFDRNSTADQAAKKKSTELYADNGHFTDPSTVTVTGAPEGYPFKYVGNGDYSGHYISHVRVVYARDAAGNALKDADGNYIIDHLEHVSSGTPLHYGTELTTNIDGPYHYATGTRPQQFLLMDEAKNTYYGYCIDLATGAEQSTWYALANLEDNDYYASQEAEDHVRGIVFNGYWGTEEGTGSLASLKEALKAAVAAGTVEDDYNIKMVNRKKFTTGYELAAGEYHYGSYVYWDLDPVAVTLTDEIIDAMTEGEALDAMQAAIWSWANGSQATLNGVDGVVVGDLSAASSQTSDSLNGKNDPEGAARTRALYAWLMQQTSEVESVVINDKTFVEDMSLTIGDQLPGGIFEAGLHFSNSFTVNQEKDNLKIVLTYVDADGVTQTIEKSLTGEGALIAEDGYYTIDGLTLKQNVPFQFSLQIVGEQYLTKNAYIFTSEKGVTGSQTFVSMAEGTINVDVSKSVEISFRVNNSVTYEEPPKHETPTPNPTADKTDEMVDRNTNRFEVEIAVPGEDGDKRHDEVILMVDGSYSMDNEWPAMKEAIITIGETVLNGRGNTQLTLMAFGMGDNEVLVHVKDAGELAAALGELPGNLLYGRSSTNCEAGFTGVANYIRNHDSSLNEVNVIFISDGNINTDEHVSEFYDWQNNGWHKFTVQQITEGAFALECAYISDAGLNASNAYKTIFGDANAADMITWAADGEPSFKAGAANQEQLIAWANQAWEDAYAYSGLIPHVQYPVSVVERAFAKYDKEHNTHIQDAFYYALIGRSYPNRATRTPAAANELANMDEVAKLYMVDYDSKSAWMELGNDKAEFVQSNGIAGLCEALQGALTDLAKTPFNDVYVTDYMSKWVNLDVSTLKIVDNSTGEIIWTATDGWKIAENRPTAQEVPVVVELVPADQYVNGGADVEGNKSGDIYKLTWYVKDGAMLRSDTYSLKYEVTVDTAEESFEYNKEYPANGDTKLNYTDENGTKKDKDIEVPPVDGVKTTVEKIVINKVDNNGKPLGGAKFALYSVKDGDELIGEYEVDEDGKISIENLTPGTYKLVETVAPNGYTGVRDPMFFEIVAKEGAFEINPVYKEFELEFPATAYEISNHITSVAIPQTFVMLDGDKAGSWSYSGQYSFGESDYRVVYCGDSAVGAKDGTRYVKTDLEECFDANTANKLRAIVGNSYPYVSVEDVRAAAAAAGVADAENLTRGDMIAASQLAIWHYTNGDNYTYTESYSVADYERWGKVFNDYASELPENLQALTGTTNRIVDEASDARVRALYNYLLALDPTSAANSDVDVFFYTANGGKDVSQSMIGGDKSTFYTEGLEIYVKNFAPKAPNNPKPPVTPDVPPVKPEPPVNKEADGLDKNDQTNVTLTVGGKTEAAPVDIVIALGAGIASEDNTRESMLTLVKPLVENGVPVKLGLIAVEHYKDVAMGLTELTAENYESIIDGGLATIKAMPAGPTNLHSNIEAAKAMLDADGTVEASNKYFYVIATGRTYNFDNEYGQPTTIINTVDLKGQHYYYWGHYLWQSQRGQHTSLYMIPDRYNNDFNAFWADVEKWVAADGDKYAYTFPIADYENPQWFNNYLAENGKDAKALGLASSRFGWIINDLTGTTTDAISSGTNPQNALNYERAQYEAYYAYKAMVDAGYNCQALCSESPSYQNGSPYIQVQKYTGTSNIQLGHSFMNHMAKLSGQENAPILFQMTNNNGNYKFAENFFTAIEAAGGIATIAPGSYVEDFIGANENGNFEFMPEAEYLTLVNNGVKYITDKVDAKEGATASFTFTDPEATEPTFWLDYYSGDGKTTEKFIWTFGEEVTSDKPVTLTYKLQLTEKQTADGKYTVNTNNSATLYPEGGEEKGFPVPEVNYTVETPDEDITITFKPGDASNISFMLFDKATGEVEFLKKIDIGNETSFKIPTAEGKISAVFVKQSTSGMFWTSEELDKTEQAAVIECLKANNPSYKGYNAFAYGNGEHQLEFKKGKFVTYLFEGAPSANLEATLPEAPVAPEASAPETPVVPEAPKPTEPTKPTKPAKPAEPAVKRTLTFKKKEVSEVTFILIDEATKEVSSIETVKVGSKDTSLDIPSESGKISVAYVCYSAGTGLIWASEEIDETTQVTVIAALKANANTEFVFGNGSFKLQYKKNKSATYTFK